MSDDDYSYYNLKKMNSIDRLEKEVTRFYGPVNGLFRRNVIKDYYLNGVAIKKGTKIMTQPLGVHYSEKYYKNTTEFRPERWISE